MIIKKLTCSCLALCFSYSAFAKLHFATPYSPRVSVSEVSQLFAKELSNSGIEVVFHPGESLYKHGEIYRATRTNQIQIGEVFIGLLGNKSAIYQLDNLPFLATDIEHAKALWQVQRVQIAKLLAKDGLVLLFANPWPAQGVFSTSKITTIDDLAGKKLRTYSAITASLARHLDAIPTSISAPEIAQAFATKMVDAMITSPATGVSSRAWQFSKHYLAVNAWIPKNIVFINRETFLSLTSEQQHNIRALAGKLEALAWQASVQEGELKTQQLVDNGMHIDKPSVELVNTFKAIGIKMRSEWLVHANEEEKSLLDEYLKGAQND